MKTISCWAKRNTNAARLLITLLQLFLFILAALLGVILLQSGIRLPNIAVIIPLFIFILSIFFFRYTKRKQAHHKQYLQQRISFFLMGTSIFLLIAFFVGSEKLLNWNVYPYLSGRESVIMMKPALFPGGRLSAAQTKKAEHLLRKIEKRRGVIALYMFLIIFTAVMLLIGISALSCALMCNGYGVLALFILLLGGGGVVFLLVWLLRKVLKDQPPPPERTKPSWLPVPSQGPPFRFRKHKEN